MCRSAPLLPPGTEEAPGDSSGRLSLVCLLCTGSERSLNADLSSSQLLRVGGETYPLLHPAPTHIPWVSKSWGAAG